MTQFDPEKKEYIGDGVHAYFDGYQIIIETKRQREDYASPTFERHWIALEGPTLVALVRYATKLREFYVERVRGKEVTNETPPN